MTGMFSLKDRHKSSSRAGTSIHSLSSHRTSLVKSKSPSSFSSSSSSSSSSSPIDYALLPKKIIKATLSYTAQSQHELSFEKGDFFHVVGRENDHHWFAVNNPLTNVHGLVPVSYFQVVDKATRTMSVLQPVLPAGYPGTELGDASKRSSMKQQQHYYGRVLYDFVAERPDELDCKADEAIIVIAQSNKEWYVAKPIGRLGGPGLIPVSFVQLHDVITNHPIPTKSHHHTPSIATSTTSVSIPNLDEWKQRTQIYEASSIPLTDRDPQSPLPSSSSMSKCSSEQHGRRYSSALNQLAHPSPSPPFSHHQPKSTSAPLSNPRRNSEFVVIKNRTSPTTHKQQQSSVVTATPTVVDITVNSFIMEGDEYWFVLYATVNNGKHRILYRTYERFYQFHLRLLQQYPEEAGKGDKDRILPFMPGPLEYVNDHITEQRREDLDHYCKTLLSLPDYLSTCPLLQQDLFGLDHDDVETDYAPKKGSRAIKSSTNTYYNGGVGKVKIKIVHKDDIYAVKIPADCTLQELMLRVEERLGRVPGNMKYKDDTHYTDETLLPLESEVDMEEAFILAIQRGKLTIVVD